MQGCLIQGQVVPDSLIGEMLDSAPLLDRPQALRDRLAEDGYVYLRGVLAPELVAPARHEVLDRLHEVGEISISGNTPALRRLAVDILNR